MMNIFQSINKVMEQIGAIGKNNKNQQQGFMYRGIDAVMNALSPAFTANKVFVVPEVLEQTREERTSVKRASDGTERTSTLLYSLIKVKYTFYAEDGSFVSATVIGEGMDSGDKATNKAMSIAFKYACFQVFCIPTEEMVDPDAECHEVKPKNAKNDEKASAPAATEPKQEVVEDVNKKVIDEAKVKVLAAAIAKQGIDMTKVLKLYKVDSLASMNVRQWNHCMQNLEKIKDVEV